MAAAAASGSYVVQSGDTLSGIADKLGVNVSELVALNTLADPNVIVPGQVLLTGSHDTPRSIVTAPVIEGTHVVRPGESLSQVARDHRIDVETLSHANGIVGGRLIVGVRLRLTAPLVDFTPTAARVHRVQAGESLATIAAGHDTTVVRLLAYNHIHHPDHLQPGTDIVFEPGWVCPVPAAAFSNDWGLVKSSGRTHEGIDMYAPRGAAIVAPVSGHIHQAVGEVGGLQFTLLGDDGFIYFGSHMEAFGAVGNVTAGQAIGTVGTSGNASNTSPHLHFEAHPEDSAGSVNPYPVLLAACR